MAGRGSTKSLTSASGKKYWREADARPVVRAWRLSGLELSRFAAEHGINAARLSRWARRLGAGPGGKRGNARLRFHPVELMGGEGAGHRVAIEVVLFDGRRVSLPCGFAAEDLERVLEVLERRVRC
jgi:hypothetical protein